MSLEAWAASWCRTNQRADDEADQGYEVNTAELAEVCKVLGIDDEE